MSKNTRILEFKKRVYLSVGDISTWSYRIFVGLETTSFMFKEQWQKEGKEYHVTYNELFGDM